MPHSVDSPTLTEDGRLDLRLVGRQRELAVLDETLATVRAGRSATLLLRGAAGVGKTALLGALRREAAGCVVAHVAAASSERDLPYAVLHQLCRPLADRLDRLPAPQRKILDAVLALGVAGSVDRLFLGAAVLNLVVEAAADRPLVCIVDDAQWLDAESSTVLAFVARRLASEPVALVVATSSPDAGRNLAGLPKLTVGGLADRDARALLVSALGRPLDRRVRDRIIAEARGNPGVLLAVARESAPSLLAGGFGDPEAAIPRSDDSDIADLLSDLSEEARMVLLLAAAEPTGEPHMLWRASEMLGISATAADEARATELISIDVQVRFGHPLVRGAVYRSALLEERRLAHGALAAATDPVADPERRAWHRAREVAAPDEEIAADLERSAARAARFGGLAAAAAFLRKATTLTPMPAVRARRALAAAEAARLAGDAETSSRVLVTTEAAPMDAVDRARAQLLRARLGAGPADEGTAANLLVAAQRLEPLDAQRAREAYLDAIAATAILGPHAGTEPGTIARAALAMPASEAPRPVDLLLEGIARQVIDGPAAAMPCLRRALDAFDRNDVAPEESCGWGWFAAYVAAAIWDHDTQDSLARRHVAQARESGALLTLPLTLTQLLGIHLRQGELRHAEALMHEAEASMRMTAVEPLPHLQMLLAAYRGHEGEARALIEGARRQSGTAAGGLPAMLVHYAGALLANGLGRYDEALTEARIALQDPEPIGAPGWLLPELVEAAVRAGEPMEGAAAFDRLADRARLCGSDWALGLEARSQALLSDGDDAERLHREAIALLDGAGSRVELSRAHLVYGEWLRRAGRRIESREHLRTAHASFTVMEMKAFAERAERELRATGETARKRTAETRDDLTAQELQIAQLAREGLSNSEIGARLFLSPRTIEWHLHRVFWKLDVRSRRNLADVLPDAEREFVSA
jgi:DNA-binding CsgD family transcriptional regulator